MAARYASASICCRPEQAMPSEQRLHPATLLFELFGQRELRKVIAGDSELVHETF